MEKVPTAAEILKDHELPLKKQKLAEFHNLNQVPFNMHIQQIYANLDPVYFQCLQEFSAVNRHISAFKPVVQSIKESKIRHANAMGRYTTDPPVLQNPERVVLMSESERFERSYQPNVALAPPTPKKRYGRSTEFAIVKNQVTSPVKSEPETPPIVTIKENHIDEKPIVDSAIPIVQSRPKYNPEIELSTDTEDSASETSEKQEFTKLEEVLKGVDTSIKDRVLEFIKLLTKENDRLVQVCRSKDDKINELESKNSALLEELSVLKLKCPESQSDKKIIFENGDIHHNECNDSVNSSSIITSTDSIASSETKVNDAQQKSVIASVGEQKEAIIKTAPE
ncbi:hypothetical protein JTB14_036528 [Gonioctena quinquepunctata]|nr:hypothetical protein JTB14_036528 [Gonioctena quinquepunctata]